MKNKQMTRGDLKALIKECLIEVLTSGLGDELEESVQEARQLRAREPDATPQRVDETWRAPVARQPTMKNDISMVLRGNKLSIPNLADILTDTASTTYAVNADSLTAGIFTQATDAMEIAATSAMHQPGMTNEARVMSQVEPETVFGEDMMARWAALSAPKQGLKP